MGNTLREELEILRQASLRRRISALEREIEHLKPPIGAARRVKFFRLLGKKRRLEQRLYQGEMFVSL